MKYLPLIPAICLLASCEKTETKVALDISDSDKPSIYTTFYPTQYFAQRIADDYADVICPVPPGADPIFWKPTSKIISDYQQADLILLNGASFAKWVETVNLPESRIVNTSASFSSKFITYENAVKHQHGDNGTHSHEGLDGHTWIDPVNAIMQADAIKSALIKKWPEEKERFVTNFASLKNDLESLDGELKAASNSSPVLSSHPAYNYSARRYGWNIYSLDFDLEEMPADEVFAALKTTLESHPAKTILWEGAPNELIKERFKSELGLDSVVFSPCELAPESGDYLSAMKRNIKALQSAMKHPLTSEIDQ